MIISYAIRVFILKNNQLVITTMTATQKFLAYGVGATAFYVGLSKGLRSFFASTDASRPQRLEQVEMEKKIRQQQIG